MTFYFSDPKPNLLKEILKYAIKNDLYENLMEDLYHNLQLTYKTDNQKLLYICHPNTHRLIKDLVLYEASLEDSDLKFSTNIASILKKDLKLHLKERSSFILLAFVETDWLKKLIPKKEIKKAAEKVKEGGQGL